MQKNKTFYSPFPISVFVLGAIILISIYSAISADLPILPFVCYLLLGGLIYYFTFCRYSCSIKVDKGKIDIRYVFKKITIEFERVLVVDYNDSYYSLGSFKKHTSSVHDFPLYPYDSLKLIVVDEFGKKDSIELKINTLLLRFNKFKYFLESNCK